MRSPFTILLLLLTVTSGYSQANLINQANAALLAGDHTTAATLYDEAELKCNDLEAITNNRAVLTALAGDRFKWYGCKWG